MFGFNAYKSHEATQARIHADQQRALGLVVQPKLDQIGKLVFGAYSGWKRTHPGAVDPLTAAYTETQLPEHRVQITANTSNNEVVMGTKLVNGKRVPNPRDTMYAYVTTHGDGTIADQYYLADPDGTRYIPQGIPQAALESHDYFAGSSGPGAQGVMSIEDTTVWNDNWSNPAAVATDIWQNEGLSQVITVWEGNHRAVNSTANPSD